MGYKGIRRRKSNVTLGPVAVAVGAAGMIVLSALWGAGAFASAQPTLNSIPDQAAAAWMYPGVGHHHGTTPTPADTGTADTPTAPTPTPTDLPTGTTPAGTPTPSATVIPTTSTPSPTSTPTVSPSGTPTATMWLPTADHPLALQWVLDGPLNLNDPVAMGLRSMSGAVLPAPDVYDIDGEYNTAATVAALHAQGKKVICYFDAGVYETYRSDAASFPAGIWGHKDQGWNGSYWLDIRRINDLAPIMQARIAMCKAKGFDAVEPDEITGWSNDSGFPLTYQDQIAYNRAIASWVHAAGMSVLLKGDIEQAHDLVNNFDFTLNEECFAYAECTDVYNPADGNDYPGLQLFVQQDKAVFVAEYDSSNWTATCVTSQTQHFNTSLYALGLPQDGGRTPCTGTW